MEKHFGLFDFLHMVVLFYLVYNEMSLCIKGD